MHLSQEEAFRLIKEPKKIADEEPYAFPDFGETLILDLLSLNEREKFKLDVNRRNRINTLKCTYQNRYQIIIPLIRIDVNGPPHDNPDHSTVGRNHIHIYREGFDDKFAYELNKQGLTKLLQELNLSSDLIGSLNLDTNDLLKLFFDFCRLINIIGKPNINFQQRFL